MPSLLEALTIAASAVGVLLGLGAGVSLLRERRRRKATLAGVAAKSGAQDEAASDEEFRRFTVRDYVLDKDVRSLLDQHLYEAASHPSRPSPGQPGRRAAQGGSTA